MKKRLLVMSALITAMICVVVMLSKSGPPTPKVQADRQTIKVTRGTYCWEGRLKTTCEDTALPPDIVKSQQMQPKRVAPNADIGIKFSRKPNADTLGVNIWSGEQAENVPLTNNHFRAPRRPGVYVYNIFARWDEGDASYTFTIEVK